VSCHWAAGSGLRDGATFDGQGRLQGRSPKWPRPQAPHRTHAAPLPSHSLPSFPSPHPIAGFKIGLCSSPPLYTDAAGLCISNNTAIRGPLAQGYERFLKLYRARAHIHHYLEYVPADEFQKAAEAVTSLISDYSFDE
jgi:hypothetical protein